MHDTAWKTAVFSVYQANETYKAYKVIYSFGLSEKEINGIIGVRGRAEGKAEEIIEMGQEFGLDDAAILKRLQERIGLSLETAAAYLEQYGKQLCRHMWIS